MIHLHVAFNSSLRIATMTNRTIFVTGATGVQGSAVVNSLLKSNQNHTIHTLVRDTASKKAQPLTQTGVKIFPGDFNDIDSLTSAAKGCEFAFINVSPIPGDPEGEFRHGRNAIEACQRAGVRHVILSSIPHLDKWEAFCNASPEDGMLKYRRSKVDVVKVLKSTGFASWTVLEVSRLLSSFVHPLSQFVFPSLATEGVIRSALKSGVEQSVVDPASVGEVVIAIVGDTTDRFRDKHLGLADGQMSLSAIVDEMNAVLGKERVKLELLGEEQAREIAQKGNPIVATEMLFNQHPDMLVLDNSKIRISGKAGIRPFLQREAENLDRAVRAKTG